MNTLLLLVVATCCIGLGNCLPDGALQERQNRAFSLFNVVKFKNTQCQSTNSENLQGVCYTSEECSDVGGTADGNCAAGFGVCCIINVNTCGGSVSQNCSYISNVGYPSGRTATGACSYTVTRCSSEICQVRLDFINMNIAQPTAAATGLCVDTLVITPGALPATNRNILPPTLCGNQAGQHVYVDAGVATTAATLAFTTATSGTGTWRVKVSQIECSSEHKAPNNCLQYFTGAVNTVTTFNWNGGAGDCTTGCLTQTQNYAACFRKESGMCSIQYTPSAVTSGDAFNLGNNGGAGTFASTGIANCANAYLQIPNVVPTTLAVTNPAINTQIDNVFCGTQLNIVDDAVDTAGANSGSIMSNADQFKIQVVAGNGLAQASLAGFSLDAVQRPC